MTSGENKGEQLIIEEWQRKIQSLLIKSILRVNEPMRLHTSMQVGGSADLFIEGKSEEEILAVMRCAREEDIPLFVMGRGSNLVVRDGGIRGIVLQIALDTLRVQGVSLTAAAGCKLPFVAREAMQKNLAGLEFAQGIPGSMGGAVIMNAGAYGGEIADVLRRVRYIDENLNVVEREIQPGDLGYRSSVFAARGWTVLCAEFTLHRDTDGSARKRFDEFRKLRNEKQPIEWPSAGSTFKRPEGYFAGKLIQDAGLRGHQRGGAQISEKHAGFIINTGAASAADVLGLIEEIQSKVASTSGVYLEPEVKIVGEKE